MWIVFHINAYHKKSYIVLSYTIFSLLSMKSLYRVFQVRVNAKKSRFGQNREPE